MTQPQHEVDGPPSPEPGADPRPARGLSWTSPLVLLAALGRGVFAAIAHGPGWALGALVWLGHWLVAYLWAHPRMLIVVLIGFLGLAAGIKDWLTQKPQDEPRESPNQFVAPPLSPSGAPAQDGEVWENSLGMRMKRISAGGFWMGSRDTRESLQEAGIAVPDDEDLSNERPGRQVRITRPFYLATMEVTRGQFAQFVQDTDHVTDAERYGVRGYDEATRSWAFGQQYNWTNTGFRQSATHPVVNVSWHDAQAFCAWLGGKEGKAYRLPTEAEWEYACRAGTRTRFSTGDQAHTLEGRANLQDASSKAKFDFKANVRAEFDDEWPFTAHVDMYTSNAWGLYNMHGNAAEWCADWYARDSYRDSPQEDPSGPATGVARCVRGGSWLAPAVLCRAARRGGLDPSSRDPGLGFRVALSPPDE